MGLHDYLELMPSVATRAVTVRVSRQFTGTIECVFDAWLDPVTAGSFLFATDAGELVRAEIDARIGGRFSFVRRENGTEVRRAPGNISRSIDLTCSCSASATTHVTQRMIG